MKIILDIEDMQSNRIVNFGMKVKSTGEFDLTQNDENFVTMKTSNKLLANAAIDIFFSEITSVISKRIEDFKNYAFEGRKQEATIKI